MLVLVLVLVPDSDRAIEEPSMINSLVDVIFRLGRSSLNSLMTDSESFRLTQFSLWTMDMDNDQKRNYQVRGLRFQSSSINDRIHK